MHANGAAPRDRLAAALDAARSARRLSLVPFVTAGFPDVSTCAELLDAIASAGADAIELGVPFTDPLADGPTIQRTSQIALAGGMRLAGVLDLVVGFRRRHRTPIVLMTYANPLLRRDVERFAGDAVSAGVEGVLVTDVPHDELPELWRAVDRARLGTVRLVAPTTAPARVEEIARSATGFVYCVSRTGVTGKGASFAKNLAEQVSRARAASRRPVLVGFGVREPADVEAVKPVADGVIVGAALLECVLEAPSPQAGVAGAARLVERLAASLER